MKFLAVIALALLVFAQPVQSQSLISGLSLASDRWELRGPMPPWPGGIWTIYWLVEGDAELASIAGRLDGFQEWGFLLDIEPGDPEVTVELLEDGGFRANAESCMSGSGIRLMATFRVFVVGIADGSDRDICLQAPEPGANEGGFEELMACDGLQVSIARRPVDHGLSPDGCLKLYACAPGFSHWRALLPELNGAVGQVVDFPMILEQDFGLNDCSPTGTLSGPAQLRLRISWDPSVATLESFELVSGPAWKLDSSSSLGSYEVDLIDSDIIEAEDFAVFKFQVVGQGETPIQFELFDVLGERFYRKATENFTSTGIDGHLRVRPVAAERISFGALKVLH